MKRLPLITLLILLYNCVTCAAQTKFEPQILILAPGDFTFDPSLKKEVDLKNDNLKKSILHAQQTLAKQNDKESTQPANIKLIQQSSINFLQNLDLAKELSMLAQQYLVYRFYEKFPNCLILLKDEKANGNRDALQKIANKEHIPYVLNFSKVSLYRQKGEIYCKLQMQLYEEQSNKLLIDKEYAGDWNNPGFEFSCEQGSIDCTINNALSFAMPDVISEVASNNPTLIKERALAAQRLNYISTEVYPQKFDDGLIRQVIPAANTDIGLNDLYQCFYNKDHSKFVAFFIKILDDKDAKPILSEKKDKNVNIITSKDIHDPGYLNQSPKTYAYIVCGVQYQNKWYTEKSEVTYFDAANLEEGKIEFLNNLQSWGYFADDTAKPGNNFWEGSLFEKIKDKRKDPNWTKYKDDIWKTEELENRDYIGMYELVANVLKKEKEDKDKAFRKQLIENTLIPFYNKQVELKSNQIFKTDIPKQYNLIYPKDMSVIINPIKITDSNGVDHIRYFVFLMETHEVFEWNLVMPNLIIKGDYADEPITKTISKFTPWDYSYTTLDDNAFWSEKVLAKDGSKYKYLIKLQ